MHTRKTKHKIFGGAAAFCGKGFKWFCRALLVLNMPKLLRGKHKETASGL